MYRCELLENMGGTVDNELEEIVSVRRLRSNIDF